MHKLCQVESSPKKYQLTVTVLFIVQIVNGEKCEWETTRSIMQQIFSCRVGWKIMQLVKKCEYKIQQKWQLQTKPLTIALMVMHSIPVHGEVKGVGLVDQIWLSLQDCDNEGETIKLFRLLIYKQQRLYCFYIHLVNLQNYFFLEQMWL